MRQSNIVIFFGGCSSEYSVSLQSAYAVLKNLDRSRFCPLPVGITREGEWFYFHGDPEKILQDRWQNSADCVPAVLSPSRKAHALMLLRNGKNELLPVDAAFPVLHGKNGEDGTLQGLIELAGIPLVGCGVLSSALCMDKHRAHRLAADAGVRVPKAKTFGRSEREEMTRFAETVGYPLFVKPVRSGSSYGISRVSSPADLPEAARIAFFHDDTVIVEENIEGFEVGCAVLGRESLLLGEVDEISLSGGFFDFTEKYTLKTSAIHVPARLPVITRERVRQTAAVIYRALDCRGFARVDMFFTPGGEIVFNEVNTIPGFTEHSRYPGMMKAAGFSFREILTRIVEDALKDAE